MTVTAHTNTCVLSVGKRGIEHERAVLIEYLDLTVLSVLQMRAIAIVFMFVGFDSSQACSVRVVFRKTFFFVSRSTWGRRAFIV